MKKYRKKRWKIFINSDNGKNWNCIVRADSFDDAVQLARDLFSSFNITGAQRC